MRKIAVFTSTRAEYGLLKSIIRGIANSIDIELKLIVSGTHLSPDFGMTINEIKDDGFVVDEEIEIIVSHDTPTGICKSMGLAMIGYGETLMRLKPDILVILGDRYEAFCAAAAAQINRVPVAHIHGGEVTEGAVDEVFRHSISKMSHLHFASCDEYRQRIIQLGEDPERVFNTGSLGVENIRKMSFMKQSELGREIGFNLEKPYFLVTFHPVTLEKNTSEEQFQQLLKALERYPDYNIIFTKANADTEGRKINLIIDNYVSMHQDRCFATASLGSYRYLSALKYTAAIIGNSSSGILEAPALKIPTINIGDRQKGRILASSVINCCPDARSVQEAINHAFSLGFQQGLSAVSNPYERPDTCLRIVKLLTKIDINGIMKKKFYDINFSGA